MVTATTVKRRVWIAIGLTGLGLGGALAAPATGGAGLSEPATEMAEPVAITPLSEATTQQNVFTHVNAHRARYGAPAVRYNYAATVAAQRHANDMARRGVMTHYGSDGSNGGQRLTRAGLRWTSWAENIAVGHTSSSSVVSAWMNSSGHRANLLNPRFRWMGVGLAYGYGRIWWSVTLAST